jgi:hypothetical protein
MFKTATATLALLALANPALAAACATPNEAAALRTAVIQQELMVAALQCHETAAYNRFVIGYQGELQTSDAILKSFFVRRGGEHGEAGYDTFKTKAANLSALEQARNGQAFCADAHALFAAAFANKGGLMSFVEGHAASADIGGICAESRPMVARSEPASGPVRVAAQPSEIGGVPAHNLPSMPYRREDLPPPTPRSQANAAPDYDADIDEDEPLAPPPQPARARYSDEYQRGGYADRGYVPRDAGPGHYGSPPGWQYQQRDWRDYPPPPPPRYRWYSY